MEYQLTPKWEESKGAFIITNYDEIKEKVDEYVANIPTQMVIQDSLDLKIIKEKRADLNANIKALKSSRILVVKLLTNEFASDLYELEKKMSSVEETLGEKISTYNREVLNKPEKPKAVSLTFKSTDLEILAKIENYAKTLGLTSEETRKKEKENGK